MSGHTGFIARVHGFVHRHFLWFLVGSYLLAAFWPSPGAALRQTTLFEAGPGIVISLPILLLAALLFNAGLAADVADLAGVIRGPWALLAGLAATVAVPLAFVVLLGVGLGWWHDPVEAQCLLLGLGVVAAMPVAGSSAAWSETAGGSSALSLGLVIGSTLLSPLTTPFALGVIGPLVEGECTSEVQGLGGAAIVPFLVVGVMIPSLAGMAVRRWVGPRILALIQPRLKQAGTAVLLILCYGNATASLPGIAAEPDWDYLLMVVLAALALCATGFAAGWAVARLVGAGGPQRRSLIFALGMTNNGTGLVLAGSALAGVPAAVIPVLVYNLVQHLLAAAVSHTLCPGARRVRVTDQITQKRLGVGSKVSDKEG